MAEIKDKVVTVESLAALHENNKKTYMINTNPVGGGSFSMNRKPDTTIGSCSVSMGFETTASGENSFAEGKWTHAIGKDSHTEGYMTTASNSFSHAEGWTTTASGISSHAEGDGTIASGGAQHVQGKYNIEDTEDKYAHIVGNGSSDKSRSNAHTLDWNGSAWFAGNFSSDGNIILTANQYGDTLPSAGTVGRVFFKRVNKIENNLGDKI